jgi:hypothetical protein
MERSKRRVKITKNKFYQIIREEIKAVFEEEDGPIYDRDDAYVAKYDAEFRKEVCLRKRNRGKFVNWFVRDGKGRCEKVTTLNEAYDSDEFATSAGMQQDLDMRATRGDFEKGDYGNVGPDSGEMMDKSEFPWIQAALEDLSNESRTDKLKAIEALADELGINVELI